jgi:ubiquinone biosynthesis monooxygenase Coq7
LDGLLAEIDRALTVLSGAATASRPNPAHGLESAHPLSPNEVRRSAGMMRVNHVGEVCAQALYRGQAVMCKDEPTRKLLLQAASEEVDHLVWCDDRLRVLNHRSSLLNPFWYAGAFSLGLAASWAGVPYNLGFMAETERQVEAHLDAHLTQLSLDDLPSRRIVEVMKADEMAHRQTAEGAGAQALAWPIKTLMRAMSKVMTSTSYYA